MLSKLTIEVEGQWEENPLWQISADGLTVDFPFDCCPQDICYLRIGDTEYRAIIEHRNSGTDFIVFEATTLGLVPISIRRILEEGQLEVFLIHE